MARRHVENLNALDRGFAAQQTEAAIGVAVLKRMLATARRDSVRRQSVIA